MNTRVPLLLLITMLASSGLAHAFRDGVTLHSGDPTINGGRSCDRCHGAGPVPVDISGPMTVTAGSTNRYTLRISGGPGTWGGLDVSATMGLLAAVEADTRVMSGELIQNTPRADVGGAITYSFDWTAPPTPGPATLYGAGVAANGDGRDTGDLAGRIALLVTVESAPAPNEPPVANPGGPYTGSVGAPVAFDGSASFDPDGTIVSYSWDCGDGSMESGPNPTHAYASEGSFNVVLTVTDDAGATGTTTTLANISANPQNQPPVAFAGGPYSGLVGMPITFDGSGSTDPGGSIAAYIWDFGDGTNGSGAVVTHSYGAAGAYQVMLTVTDNQGASDTDTADAVVRDAGTPSLLVLVRSPRWARVPDDEGREVNVQVTVDLSDLPPGTTGCGTATLFKDGQEVGTQPLCIERRDEDDDADADDERLGRDDRRGSQRRSEREDRTLRLKTAQGVIAMPRPWRGMWARANFEVQLTQADAPSVVWTARVEFLGRLGESAPATTGVGGRRPRR